MIENIWFIPLGFVAGVLGSIIGFGGGIIVVPVLLFLGIPPTVAASSSLFAAFSNATASSISYSRQRRINYSLGLKLGLLSIPGTIIGAYISSEITPPVFKILIAIVLIASSFYIFLNRRIQSKKINLSTKIMIIAISASFFSGIISALFGIGGGIIFVPLMVIAMGISMKFAAPTSHFILLFAAASGAIIHSLMGHSDYTLAAFLAIGAFGGGLLGARLSIEIKEKWLKILISVVMIVASIKLVIDSLEIRF